MNARMERFFCDTCNGKTKHHIRGEYNKHDNRDLSWLKQRMLIIECCGCENLAFVKMTLFSEHIEYSDDPGTDGTSSWNEVIYPPVTYRMPPTWLEDLPDPTLRAISDEIYRSLQTGSHYLAAFGSRTLIDRLIVLTVGDKGNFAKGLTALQDEGKISKLERDILEPTIQAGHAAAHRGWAPTREQLATILNTVEGLIYRLLVLPKLAEELEEAVPSKMVKKGPNTAGTTSNINEKIKSLPKGLREIYDELVLALKSLGDDVKSSTQKHYIAFRRNRNFASVQIYNKLKIIKVYLNLNPDAVKFNGIEIRDVRQIGHYGTGDLEIIVKSKKDVSTALDLLKASYDAS